MWDIPRSSPRSFTEPLTGAPHLKKVLVKRFLSFIESIKTSKKIALKNLFKVVKDDCRSVTGKNLSKIRDLVGKTGVDSLVPADSAEIRYCEIEENDRWRLGIVSELTDAKFGLATVDGFSRAELKTILVHVCTT